MMAPSDLEKMAPPPGPPAGPGLLTLRQLRAEVQDLQTVLAGVRKGEVALKTYADYVQKTAQDVADLMEQLEAAETVPPNLVASVELGDAIRHLHNACHHITSSPLLKNPQADFDPQQQLHYLNMLDSQIRRVVFLVGTLTIPARVNSWLAKARPGYYIPFHLVFEDELPSMEDRVKVLSYLAWSPEVVKGGIVDVANGLIYRYARSPKDRARSLALLAAAFVLSTALVVGACFLPLQGWPIGPGDLSGFVVGWSAILVGVLTHAGIGSVKRSRSQGGLPPILAVGDLPLIVDAMVGQMLLRLLLILIGFFGFAFVGGVGNVTPLNAFLVGYSLDSFVELFGASIEQRVSAQTAALRQKVGVGSE